MPTKSLRTPQSTTKLAIHPTLLVIGIFILATLWFNRFAVAELRTIDPYRTFGRDTIAVRYFAQKFTTNLLHGRNPLQYIPQLVYPFGIPAAIGEVGPFHILFFATLGSFLNPHQTFMTMILITFFFAQAATYALARSIKLSRPTSTLAALTFAFTPFIGALRITEHYTYLHHFSLPLASLTLIKLYQADTPKKRRLWAVAVGLATALIAYITLYFLIMWAIMVSLFCFIYCLFHRDVLKPILVYIHTLLPNLAITAGIFALATAPLTLPLIKIASLHAYPRTTLDLGYTTFAAHPLAIFIPNSTNPVYGSLVTNSPFRTPESLIYLGVIGFWGIYQFIRAKNKRPYLPLFLTALSLYILTLGPTLKIPSLNLPLPYTLFLHLPIVNMLRAPARFGIVLSLCTTLLAASLFQARFGKKPAKKILTIAMLIILIDQGYAPTAKATRLNLPLAAYNRIQADPGPVTVMEIPYHIRDGIQNLGNSTMVQILLGQLLHGKNVMGGYIARLSDAHFNYYRSCTLTAYTLYQSEPYPDRELRELSPATYNAMSEAADLFDLKYILVDEAAPRAASVASALTRIGYTDTFTDPTGYHLFTRTPKPTTPTILSMTTPYLECYLTGSWTNPHAGARWLTTKDPQGGFFLKSTKDNAPLSIEAAAVRTPRRVEVIVNHQHKTTITLTPEPNTYHLNLPIKQGINHVDLYVKDQVPYPLLPTPANTYLIAVSKVGLTDTFPEASNSATPTP